MIIVINCIAVKHGKVFLSKSAADLHRDGCKISLFLLPFPKLPVHGTALNKNTLGSSSQLIILNNPAIKKLRQLTFCKEQTAIHSQVTYKSPHSELAQTLSVEYC